MHPVIQIHIVQISTFFHLFTSCFQVITISPLHCCVMRNSGFYFPKHLPCIKCCFYKSLPLTMSIVSFARFAGSGLRGLCAEDISHLYSALLPCSTPFIVPLCPFGDGMVSSEPCACGYARIKVQSYNDAFVLLSVLFLMTPNL